MACRLAVVALGIGVILGARPVSADVQFYSSRASFESAITGETTDSFNELGSMTRVFTPPLTQAGGLTTPITISSPSGFLDSTSSSALAGYYPSQGTYLLGPISTTPTDGLTVTLPGGTYNAAGADVGAFISNSVVSYVVHTSLGETLTGSVSVNTASASSSLAFLGVILSSPNDFVTSLTFSTPVGASQNVLLDNVSYGFAPLSVPEPASMTLVAAGVLALGITTVRRRVGKRIA